MGNPDRFGGLRPPSGEFNSQSAPDKMEILKQRVDEAAKAKHEADMKAAKNKKTSDPTQDLAIRSLQAREAEAGSKRAETLANFKAGRSSIDTSDRAEIEASSRQRAEAVVNINAGEGRARTDLEAQAKDIDDRNRSYAEARRILESKARDAFAGAQAESDEFISADNEAEYAKRAAETPDWEMMPEPDTTVEQVRAERDAAFARMAQREADDMRRAADKADKKRKAS